MLNTYKNFFDTPFISNKQKGATTFSTTTFSITIENTKLSIMKLYAECIVERIFAQNITSLLLKLSELHSLNIKWCSKQYNKPIVLHLIVAPQLSDGWWHNYSTKTRQAGQANE